MKILVTGGGGFAGQHLLRRLVAEHDRVFATALDPLPVFAPADPLSRVEWVTMDLGSPDSIQAVLDRSRPSQIFHLAGQASVGRSFATPLETWDINATGTLRLLVALGASGLSSRLLLISSAEVYGDVPRAAHPLPEGAGMDPVNPYGASKAGAEVVALTMGRVYGIEVVVARSFNHVGPGQDARFVLPSVALQLARIKAGQAEPLVRIGNVEVERDFLDVRDVAGAYQMLMSLGEPGAIYNVASGSAHTLRTVIERLVELSGTGARLEVDPSRLRTVDIGHLSGSPDRLRKLGWTPRIPLDQSLQDLLLEAEERV